MKTAAAVLVKHIASESDIFIQLDSDCDGYTSSALLINYLHNLFPSWVENHVNYRVHDNKAHGLIVDTIPEEAKLVIAPDASSNDYEQHQELKSRGIDVIVIDHHEAEKVSENAFVLNNQLCDYPNKSLSGVGMVYKFCQYIDNLLNIDHASQFLDLVALGEIADVMDLRPFETAELVREGLSQISNPYFKGMTIRNAYSIGKKVTPFSVGFYVAPYINAVTRCGTQEEKLLIFESMLEYKAYETIPSTKRGCKGQFETRVEQAVRTCANVKNRQKKEQDRSLETIRNLIKERNLLDNQICIVCLEKSYALDKALTGLVANVITNEVQHPTLILNETELGWEGSGRNFSFSGLNNFRSFLDKSGYFEYAEGHESAFGCGIEKDNLDVFINYSNNALANIDFSPSYLVDLKFTPITLKSEDVLEIADHDDLWGQGVEEPYILITDISITAGNIALFKDTTLKITLPSGINLIKFNSNPEEFNYLNPNQGQTKISVIGRCQKNEWNDRISPQVLIVDYEVQKKLWYYF